MVPRLQPRRRSGLPWIVKFVSQATIVYLAIAAVFICPSDPSRAPAVCSSLSNIHRTLESHSRPYLHTARTKLDPYVKQAQPYIDYTKPYYAKASSAIAPHVDQAQKTYYTHAHPKVVGALSGAQKNSHAYYKAARKQSDPYFEAARKNTDPYVKAARKNTEPYVKAVRPHLDRYTALVQAIHKDHVIPQLNFATETAQKGYDAAHAHVHAHVIPAYRKAGPAANKWWREQAQPGARAAYAYSHKTYVGEVHPRIVRVIDAVWEFFRARILPLLKRWHSLYVKPQLDKITAKVFEYRTQKVGKQAKTDANAHSTEKIAKEGFKEGHDGALTSLD